jgi:hypothetical protein
MRRETWSWANSVLFVAVALGGSACSHTVVVQANGDSDATVTVSHAIKFNLKGGTRGIHIPDGVPQIGGLDIGPGAEIEVDIPAGTEIHLKDKVNIGKASSSSSTKRAAAANPVPVSPQPLSLLTSDVLSGSTYTWTIPAYFGDAGAVVPVTGSVAAMGYDGAIQSDGNGGYKLNTALVKSFSYQVSGPPAVWQAPFDTPYGRVTGDGTIETVDGMVWQSIGSPSALSGSGTDGYTAPDGTVYQYGYKGAFPVQLTSGAGVAVGATTVFGGANLF